MSTKKATKSETPTPLTGSFLNKSVVEQYDYRRLDAVNLAIRLFTETPFKDMITPKTAGGDVPDVPFYNVTNEIYEFLKTGEFTGYNEFLKKQAESKSAA